VQTPIKTADSIIKNDDTDETQLEIVETIPIKPSTTYSHDEVMEAIENEVRYTKHWDENTYDNTIRISYDDAQRLLRIAYAEAGGEGVQGQLRIMMVVWNRVNSDQFPDSIEEVIMQPNAFSSVSNGHYEDAQPTWETHMALAQFESNLCLNDDIYGFETRDNGEVLLKYFDYYDCLGNHVFYTLKKD